eukprot:gene19249-29646_t
MSLTIGCRYTYRNSAISAASGIVDRRESAPLTLGARYQIASNSKLFVAVGLHQLHEQGVVDLSDPVQAHLSPSDMAAFGYAGSRATAQSSFRTEQETAYQTNGET